MSSQNSRRLCLLLAGFAPASVLAGACFWDGFNQVASHTGPADAGGGGGANGCNSQAFPEIPSEASPGGTGSFVVALRSITVTPEQHGGPLGIDLDGACTCAGDDSTCVLDPSNDGCDAAGGRDNNAHILFSILAEAADEPNLSQAFSAGAEQGRWSTLIRVDGYNGQPNDDQVTVSWYVAANFDRLVAAAAPAWQGNDEWPILDTSVETDMLGDPDLESPVFSNEFGYVVNGSLVARLPVTEMVLEASGDADLASMVTLRVGATGLIARIEDGEFGTALRDGVFAGRLGETEMFAAVASFRGQDGAPLCTTNTAFNAVTESACKGFDIHASVEGPTVPCNALSFAVGFEAAPAKLGALVPPAAMTPGCPPESDPAVEECP